MGESEEVEQLVESAGAVHFNGLVEGKINLQETKVFTPPSYIQYFPVKMLKYRSALYNINV